MSNRHMPGKKPKPTCCKKYKREAKACKRCPKFALLSKKKRKRRLAKIRKRLKARK